MTSYRLFLLVSAMLAVRAAYAGDRGLLDTVNSPYARMYMTDLGDAKWTGGLWGDRFEVCRTAMVPRIWTIFQSDEESHEWTNLLLAAGIQNTGDHEGPGFEDGDFFKWLEGLAQVYAITHDPEVDQLMDRIIAVVAKAQWEDGYFHTATVIPQRRGARVTELQGNESFEAYNIGHLITTACVHYRATGKKTLLSVGCKAADYLFRLCREAPAKLARCSICPSHYMAVIELYRTTRDPRYLELGRDLIAIRDKIDDGTDQNQSRVPFRQMTKAVGHAVRANYLYAGATDVAIETGDRSLLETVRTINEDITNHKLYITGATGALYDGASPDGGEAGSQQLVNQAYGRDYQLSNLTAYNESCATVGFVLWNWRMLVATGDARYADLVEQTLYNGVLAAISLDGEHYFYVNPLRRLKAMTWPLRAWRTRQPNLKNCFCCPPNVVRTIAEAQDYIYTLSPGTLWINLYGGSVLDTRWIEGGRIRLRQITDYPWSGEIKIVIDEAPSDQVVLKLRIPGWIHGEQVRAELNGVPLPGSWVPGTYAEIRRRWHLNDVVKLSMPFTATLWKANPLVEETLNQVAVMYGPLVYCLESIDLPPGVGVEDVALSLDPRHEGFRARKEKIAGAELVTLTTPALCTSQTGGAPGPLYLRVDREPPREIEIKLVPYYAWNNRGDGDMTVWIPVR